MNKGWSKSRTKVEAAEQHNLHISHSSFKNRPNRVKKEKVGKISTKKKKGKRISNAPLSFTLLFLWLTTLTKQWKAPNFTPSSNWGAFYLLPTELNKFDQTKKKKKVQSDNKFVIVIETSRWIFREDKLRMKLPSLLF